MAETTFPDSSEKNVSATRTSELSLVGEAIETVLEFYGHIAKGHNDIDLRDEVDKIKLWTRDLHIADGKLDRVLEKSDQLRTSMFGILKQFTALLKIGPVDLDDIEGAPQRLSSLDERINIVYPKPFTSAGHDTQTNTEKTEDKNDTKVEAENKITKTESDRPASPALSSVTFDSDDEIMAGDYASSDEEMSFKEFVENFSDLSADFRFLGCLLVDSLKDLDSIIEEEPQKDLPPPVKASMKPEDYFENNLAVKFPEGELPLVQRVAKQCWLLYCSVKDGMERRQQVQAAPPVPVPTKASVAAPTDSGYGSMEKSLRAPSLVERIPHRAVLRSEQLAAYAMSVATSDASATDPNRAKVPKPPVELGSVEEFECPLCVQVQKSINNTRAWRKHVLSDIKPYICTFGDCQQRMTRFCSREQWMFHEFNVHRKATTYQCTIEECNDSLQTLDGFSDHIHDKHAQVSKSLSEQSLTSPAELAGLFARQVSGLGDDSIVKCPFCAAEITNRRSKLASHIGRHMEDIALPILNFAIGDDDEGSDGSAHDSDSDSEQQDEAAGAIRCLCGKGGTEGFLITCDTCGHRIHSDCMDFKAGDDIPTVVQCHVCRPPQAPQASSFSEDAAASMSQFDLGSQTTIPPAAIKSEDGLTERNPLPIRNHPPTFTQLLSDESLLGDLSQVSVATDEEERPPAKKRNYRYKDDILGRHDNDFGEWLFNSKTSLWEESDTAAPAMQEDEALAAPSSQSKLLKHNVNDDWGWLVDSLGEASDAAVPAMQEDETLAAPSPQNKLLKQGISKEEVKTTGYNEDEGMRRDSVKPSSDQLFITQETDPQDIASALFNKFGVKFDEDTVQQMKKRFVADPVARPEPTSLREMHDCALRWPSQQPIDSKQQILSYTVATGEPSTAATRTPNSQAPKICSRCQRNGTKCIPLNDVWPETCELCSKRGFDCSFSKVATEDPPEAKHPAPPLIRCVCDRTDIREDDIVYFCTDCKTGHHLACLNGKSYLSELVPCRRCGGGRFERFTLQPVSPDEPKAEEASRPIRCSCTEGTKAKEGGSFIECDSCEYWIHDRCHGVTEEDLKRIIFICDVCSKVKPPGIQWNDLREWDTIPPTPKRTIEREDTPASRRARDELQKDFDIIPPATKRTIEREEMAASRRARQRGQRDNRRNFLDTVTPPPKRTSLTEEKPMLSSPDANADSRLGVELDIRCICGLDGDDGSTLMCDTCHTLQHVICFRIDRSEPPHTWECHICGPENLAVSKAYAYEIQRKRYRRENKIKYPINLTPEKLRGLWLQDSARQREDERTSLHLKTGLGKLPKIVDGDETQLPPYVTKSGSSATKGNTDNDKPSGALLHTCPECGQTFRKSSERNQHFRELHENGLTKPYICTYSTCAQRFISYDEFELHMILSHQEWGLLDSQNAEGGEPINPTLLNASGSHDPKPRKVCKSAPPAEVSATQVEKEHKDEDTDDGDDVDEPRYCYCDQISYGRMIACDGPDCKREWFHLPCVGLSHMPSPKEKWYCADCMPAAKDPVIKVEEDSQDEDIDDADGDDADAADVDEPKYCYCDQISYGRMVACDGPDCKREWFHLPCVGLSQMPGPKEKWYCTDCMPRPKRTPQKATPARDILQGMKDTLQRNIELKKQR